MIDARTRFSAATLAVLLTATGCAAWTPGWEARPAISAHHEEPPTFEQAAQQLEQADDAASLARARKALQARLAVDADDSDTMLALADAEILRGAAYSDTRRVKREAFGNGIQHAERAMMRNPEFRERIAAGRTIGEAVHSLREDELMAMILWVTGVFYYFDEGMLLPERIIHFNRLREAREVLAHAMALNPAYQHGLPAFSLGIYYIAIPGFAGRDFDRAEALLAQAAAAGGTSLLPRWGRARYLHTARGDLEAFRADLEWVLAQDPQRADSRPHWNVFIQRDTRDLLDRIDQLF